MSTIEDLKEKFDEFYSYSPYKQRDINKVVIQTTDTKMETLDNLLREKQDGELV